MPDAAAASRYHYGDATLGHHHAYLLPPVIRELEAVPWGGGARRVFDVGCGNGSMATHLATRGFDVTGIDASAEGIAQATRAHPELHLY